MLDSGKQQSVQDLDSEYFAPMDLKHDLRMTQHLTVVNDGLVEKIS